MQGPWLFLIDFPNCKSNDEGYCCYLKLCRVLVKKRSSDNKQKQNKTKKKEGGEMKMAKKNKKFS